MANENVLQTKKELEAEDRVTALLYKAKGRPWVQDRLGRLAATGDELGASPEDIAEVINAYLKEPQDWKFGLQQKTLLCKAWKLAEAALNSPFTVSDLVEFCGNLQGIESQAMEIVRDPKTWQLIELRGRGGKREANQIITEVWARNLGVPEDTAFRLTLKQLSGAVVGLQQRGLEGAISRPEFWDSYLQTPNKLVVFERWQKKIPEEERIADAKRESELNGKIREFNRAVVKREKEWEELRRLRKEDRQRRIIEERRKRLRRRKKLRPTVTTSPDEIRIFVERRVATPWGSNFLRVYEDDTTQLIRIEPDGTPVVVLSGRHAYQVSETRSGMLHVVPVIGRRTGWRRASPMDMPSGHKRPLGMD